MGLPVVLLSFTVPVRGLRCQPRRRPTSIATFATGLLPCAELQSPECGPSLNLVARVQNLGVETRAAEKHSVLPINAASRRPHWSFACHSSALCSVVQPRVSLVVRGIGRVSFEATSQSCWRCVFVDLGRYACVWLAATKACAQTAAQTDNRSEAVLPARLDDSSSHAMPC